MSYIFEGLDNEINKNGDFAKGIQLLLNINETMGAYCLCDTFNNENLWTLYADNYEGYCIEYDLTNPCKSRGSISFISQLYPVTYVTKKDDDWFKSLFESVIKTIKIDGMADPFNSEMLFNLWLLKTLCSKRNAYSNEKEWRVLGSANTACLGPLISAIIVGHKICKNDFVKLRKWCDLNKYPMKITYLDYENQEVRIRDIEETDIQRIMKS